MRTPNVPEENFDASKISPSRLNAYKTCGVAFERYYLKNEPKKRSGSAALFGSVMHDALEHWAPNRSSNLVDLVRSAWLTCTEGTVVKDFLAEYQSLSVAAIRQEHAIREAWKAKGKESKAPRMTKEWKESEVGKAIRKLMPKWEGRLNDGSPWQFNEYDPLPALYDESLVLSKRTEARLGSLPNALYAEFAVDVEWRGFRLTGYVDVIEPIVRQDTGELAGIGVLDYKTYRKAPYAQLEGDEAGEGAELKDYFQLVTYDIAIRDLVARGALSLPIDDVPLFVGIDYLRPGERRWWRMGEGDYDYFERELTMYRAGVENGVFLGANKGTNPGFCDYGETCCLRRAGAGCATRVEVPA